jgi:hypothetical protein
MNAGTADLRPANRPSTSAVAAAASHRLLVPARDRDGRGITAVPLWRSSERSMSLAHGQLSILILTVAFSRRGLTYGDEATSAPAYASHQA